MLLVAVFSARIDMGVWPLVWLLFKGTVFLIKSLIHACRLRLLYWCNRLFRSFLDWVTVNSCYALVFCKSGTGIWSSLM